MNKSKSLLFCAYLMVFSLTGCSAAYAKQPGKAERSKYLKNTVVEENSIKEAILNGEVLIGMNKEQVLAAWGNPDDIGSWKKGDRWFEKGEEVWYYNSSLISWGRRIVEFKDGIVVRQNVTYK